MLRKSELEAEKKSIHAITKFNSFKKHMIKELEENTTERHMLIDEYEQDLMKAVDELEDNLMEIEMLLQDALKDATDKFFDTISKQNVEIQKLTTEFTTNVINHSTIFNDNLKVSALIDQTQFEQLVAEYDRTGTTPVDDPEFEMRCDLFDKEFLVAQLDSTKDFMEQKIQNYDT